MSITLSTSSLSPPDRAEFWRDAVSHTFIPLDVELYEAQPSAATITSHQLGPLQVSSVSAGPQKVVRDRRMIARGGESHLTLAIQHHGTARLEQDRREAFLEPGQFALSDSARPFLKELPAKFGFTAFHLPRTALNVPDVDLRALTATVFSPTGGCAGVVAAYLGALARDAAGVPPEAGHQLGLTACDLLATLIRERRDRHAPQAPEATRAMLVRVKDHALRHLMDPGLSPQSIADAHHVSVRYVHKLFESEDTTLAKWIQTRRLAMCRRDLARHSLGGLGVASVARRWGFVSPAHFSRAFRAAYGMSPRDWQAAARGSEHTRTPAEGPRRAYADADQG
ncbi:helix-turn-helix domain-containing protein [Streptomyces sp. NBC_01231]|nr:helix-turn-helix domain-containing protein [Streptomyces sp. NBC_01231]